MSRVSEHYDQHLAPVYAWMLGGPEACIERGRAELQAMGIGRALDALAVDLGAGFGTHAVPLAQLGYSVVAVDGCEQLLRQLGEHAAGAPIRIVHADFTAFGTYLPRSADLILCMGDTLPHLPDHAAVQRLLSEVAARLAPNGRFVATFRDYCGREPSGDARFIQVHSSATRILTCFLEYHADHIQVHDLLQQLADGDWRLRVSSYAKLRLDVHWLTARLAELGLQVQTGVNAGGMIRVLATRPGALGG